MRALSLKQRRNGACGKVHYGRSEADLEGILLFALGFGYQYIGLLSHRRKYHEVQSL